MNFRLLAATLFAISPLAGFAQTASSILILGAGGQDQYASSFRAWGADWEKACTAGDVTLAKAGGDSDKNGLETLRSLLETEPKETPMPLWLLFLGHGTSDGKEGKFNLSGNDLAASELAALLKPFHRPLIVVCGFSASGAFLKPLAGPDRVIISATKSGSENNFSRFGGYFCEAIADPLADFDKDGQTSVLEAWLFAAQQTADFYKNEGRLATEHSLLEDNGDGLGTPPDWFKGIRAVKKTKGDRALDGLRAHQIHLTASPAERLLSPAIKAERDALEQELARMRESKSGMAEEEYYAKLEPLLLQLAALYHNAGLKTR
ncbi:MAG: hypothetical protein JWL90_4621 [Chthoniobacteraceae bacterium]|nr:hypothetical protein [Chthoniobacteraceae bacterium]